MGKGAGILFIGTAFGLLFGFLSRILIARFYTPADYGLFNLYSTILGIFSGIGVIGLQSGISRNVAYYLGKEEKEKVSAIIGWGLAIALAGGIIFGSILFIFANPIASLFSENPALVEYYKLAAIAVPFYVFIRALISVFRGFQRTKERILFYNLGRNSLMLTFIVIIGIFALSFEKLILSVTITIILISISLFIWLLKIYEKKLRIKKLVKWEIPIGKKLLLFSLPLLLVTISSRIMGWSDTMMIGYFLREDSVGYYHAAKPLTMFISTALHVTLFIYSPLAASLYSQEKIKENKVLFTSITKWLCFGTLPITLTLIFYPRWLIDFLFGPGYTNAIIPLQVLALTSFINTFMGPNGATLTAYGKTKFLMYATGGAAVLNLILNVILIVYYGIIGAALATGISKISINILRTKKLKDLSGIHPIKHIITSPMILSIILSSSVAILLKNFLTINIILVALSLISFYIIYISSMVLTKSFSKDDLKLLLLIEKKLGIDLGRVKQILKKFL